MKRKDTAQLERNEIEETIRLANSIVKFYEDVLAVHVDKTSMLEAENARLQQLIGESKDLLKAVLVSPKRGIIN
jgi:hypothetical protein